MHEPELARHADEPYSVASPPRPPRARTVERNAGRFALVQALGAGLVGATTRNLNMAATAVLVTTPKASRTTPEAFAAALGRGLADQHAVLSLRPDALRRLDRVDAIVIDPRVLCTDTPAGGAHPRRRRARAVRGVEPRPAGAGEQWPPAGLAPGARDIVQRAAFCGRGTFPPAHDPLASAVVAEAHRTGAGSDLGRRRFARRVAAGVRRDPGTVGQRRSIDDALAHAVADLQQAGRTVAVLSSSGAQAISSADVALGIMPQPGAGPPPWSADLLLPDLAAVWRVLHALPAARAATQRGVGISRRRDGHGIASDDPGHPRPRPRTGDHRRGGRSALRLPAGARDHDRGRAASGVRPRMARDVGRSGPQEPYRRPTPRRQRRQSRQRMRPVGARNRPKLPRTRSGSSSRPSAPS